MAAWGPRHFQTLCCVLTLKLESVSLGLLLGRSRPRREVSFWIFVVGGRAWGVCRVAGILPLGPGRSEVMLSTECVGYSRLGQGHKFVFKAV